MKSELGTKALEERVAALRCGLDATLWNNVESANACKAARFVVAKLALDLGRG